MVKRYVLSKEYDWSGVPLTLRLVEERSGEFCVRAILFVKGDHSVYTEKVKEACLLHSRDGLEAIMEFQAISKFVERIIGDSWFYNDLEDRKSALEVLCRWKEFAF